MRGDASTAVMRTSGCLFASRIAMSAVPVQRSRMCALRGTGMRSTASRSKRRLVPKECSSFVASYFSASPSKNWRL
jgi:hypothetical protein